MFTDSINTRRTRRGPLAALACTVLTAGLVAGAAATPAVADDSYWGGPSQQEYYYEPIEFTFSTADVSRMHDVIGNIDTACGVFTDIMGVVASEITSTLADLECQNDPQMVDAVNEAYAEGSTMSGLYYQSRFSSSTDYWIYKAD